MNIPRPEHPNPQFERKAWTNLNGEWQFEIDQSKSGIEREFYKRKELSSKIIVPFCPESKLSGVGYTDFINSVWYQRKFTLTAEQMRGRVLLHFGAVDYEAVVYINQEEVGKHKGGYTSFTFDISGSIQEGENVLTVCAIDDTRSGKQPSGKQSEKYASHGCFYTRTTGIWQTVWLEYVPSNYIKQVKFYPDTKNCKLTVTAELQGSGDLAVDTSYQGQATGSAAVASSGGTVWLEIPLSEKHLWEVGQGRLYDVTLRFGEDEVSSYFGLRSVRLDGFRFLINEKSVFQRFVLDQGFYPDGIYTAPTEQDLIRDIQLSLDMGFNGARLHEKIFEPRFLYHCDKMGYPVWGEHGNWGFDHSDASGLSGFLSEWREAVARDFNHPAIIGWCPFNETWDVNGRPQDNSILETVYRETKVWDSTRPCIDTSGNYHVATDIYDVHTYVQDVEELRRIFTDFEQGKELKVQCHERQRHNGEAVFISEYGGIGWEENSGDTGWGYGTNPKTEEEFLARLQGLTDVIMDSGKIFGFCYTQLYDVEQEINGLYTYHRKPKFDSRLIHKIMSRKAKIED